MDYQELFGKNKRGVPLFTENDMWPTNPGTLPRKKRFPQLLRGTDDKASDQYHSVIVHRAKKIASSSVDNLVEPLFKWGYQPINRNKESGNV